MPTFPCPGPIELEIRVASGSLELAAEPRETAEVEVTAYDNTDASREAAEHTRVEFDGDRLAVTAPDASGWGIRWRVPRLRVIARVPAGSNALLKAAAADVTCRGDWGAVSLNTASGDAALDRLSGDLTISSASGDLRVAQVGGRLTLKSASGDINAGQVAGSVDIKSASGNVQLEQAGDDVNVKTASGDVRIGAASRGSLRATTVSGDVSIGVVSGTGVWLDLNSLTGNTRSNLTMDGDSAADQPATGHQLSIQARAVSGNIEVYRVTLPTPAA